MHGSKKIIQGSSARLLVAAIAFLLMSALTVCPAFAEGTRDLVANGGYRPYTERYNATTQGQERQSVMHVYLNAGETVYLGTSVANAKLYNTSNGTNTDFLFSNSAMGKNYSNTQLTYINTADVAIAQGNYTNIADAIAAGEYPGNGVTLVDLASDATNTTPGYIYNSTQEAGGIDFTGTGIGTGYKVTTDNTISPSASGYVDGAKTNANTYTAPADGIYTVVFFSSAHTKENPVKCLASDTHAFTALQKGGTIASWDISVYSGKTLQTGRVFTSTLFLNMGGNVLSGGVSQGSLYSKVYAVTADGYRYKVDFNGMDPYGFVFFANNRGLLKTTEDASLYHGVRSDNNYLSDIASHDITLNNTPATSQDATYNLFYESPSTEALSALNIKDPSTSGSISDFTFTGNENIGTTKATGTNEGYVGEGGTFSFTAPAGTTATSYEIDLNFGTDNTVVLSNTLVSGANSITWNGKDAKGAVVPAGTYDTSSVSVKLKGGEVHFPLLDVEQNPNGIKIGRINGTGASEASPDYTVYFNNSSLNAGDATSPWTTEKNWEVGSQTDALSGVDSSSGAMAFTNVNTAKSAKGMNLLGDGDQSALDVWADYNTPAALGTYSFNLVDASFTVTKAWDNTAGTPTAGNPSVTMTLYNSNGTKVTTDVTGASITNPVTYDTSKGTTYKWEHLDPALEYYVAEAPLTGYTTTNSGTKATVTGTVAAGYAQTVTNTYMPAKLTISKVWNHGDEPQADWPTSVVIHVYTDAAKTHEIIGSPFTLTSASTDESGNTWAQTITGLDPAASFYCFEDAVTGYTSSSGGKASGSATTGYKSTFTNSFESKQYVTAQVLKQWRGDTIDNVSYRPSSVVMTLVNKDTSNKITKDALGNPITNPIELTEDNSWYYAWSMLPTTDDKGNAIKYNILETTPNGYTASTEPKDPPLVLGNLTSVIWDNVYKTTKFTVTKTWDNGTNATQPNSATVQLQQSLDSGTTWADYGDAQTLNAAGSWTYTWDTLPTYTSDGTKIVYQAIETPIDGYTINEGSVTGSVDDGYSQTITNTYNFTKLKVTKTWDYGKQAEADRPTSVNIALEDAEGNKLTTCVLNADNSWTYTFDGLDRGTYGVVEEAVDNYVTTYGAVSGDDSSGYTVNVTNTYDKGALTVNKVWSDSDNALGQRPTSVVMRLLKDGTATGDTLVLDADNGWKGSFTNLEDGHAYTVSEDAIVGYGTSIGNVSGDFAKGWSVTVTNTVNSGSATTPATPVSLAAATTPTTGDISVSLMMIAFIAVGGAIILGIGALLFKRHDS